MGAGRGRRDGKEEEGGKGRGGKWQETGDGEGGEGWGIPRNENSVAQLVYVYYLKVWPMSLRYAHKTSLVVSPWWLWLHSLAEANTAYRKHDTSLNGGCHLLVKLFHCVILDEAISVSPRCFIGHGEEVGKSKHGEDTKAA